MARTVDPNLVSKPRARACAELKRTQPWICHLCGYPIPRDADHQRDRYGYTVDELIPRSAGGSTTDPSNLAPAHRWCNSYRNDQPITDPIRQHCRTVMTSTQPQPTSRNW